MKKILKLLTFLLLLAVAVEVRAEDWPKPVETTYIDGNGVKTVEAIPLTGYETDLSEGWYVAASTITFDHTINFSGDVHIILADDDGNAK